VAKGVDIELAPLDEDHVRAKITWSEQDVGGGKLVIDPAQDRRADQIRCDGACRAFRASLRRYDRELAPSPMAYAPGRPPEAVGAADGFCIGGVSGGRKSRLCSRRKPVRPVQRAGHHGQPM
jgi:hypothetical protein